MELSKELLKATEKVEKEKLPAIMEKYAEQMLDNIVRDMFNSYSDTAKDVKKRLSEKLNASLGELKLTNFSQLIVRTIEDKATFATNKIASVIGESIDEIIGFENREQINLSEIIDKFREYVVSESCMSDDYGEMTILVDENEKFHWHTISLDKAKNQKENSCEVSFTVHSDGICYNFRAQDFFKNGFQDLTPSSITRLTTFDRWLLRIINSGVKIVIDQTDFDCEWSKYED